MIIHVPLFYIKNIATIVVTSNPIPTGIRFFLASSKGSTLQIAATGISAQGMMVPPPMKDNLLLH